jgi:hypothetical protein
MAESGRVPAAEEPESGPSTIPGEEEAIDELCEEPFGLFLLGPSAFEPVTAPISQSANSTDWFKGR